MKTPLAHLVAGSTGAGKTTYAVGLAEHTGGVLFSIDDWMATLFAADAPQPLDPSWVWERVERCEQQILLLATQIVIAGVPVILDLGFQRAQHRESISDHIRAAGFEVRLHWLDVDADERWRRVQDRNNRKGTTFRLTITKQMFAFIEARWQAPDPDELLVLNGLRVVTASNIGDGS